MFQTGQERMVLRHSRVVKRECPNVCDPGPTLGAFQPLHHSGFVRDYVHTQLQGSKVVQRNVPFRIFQKHENNPVLLVIAISSTDSTGGVWHWSVCDSRLVRLSMFLMLCGVFQRCVLSRFFLLCPDLVTSRLLFDVVAARAVALLVGGAL